VHRFCFFSGILLFSGFSFFLSSKGGWFYRKGFSCPYSGFEERVKNRAECGNDLIFARRALNLMKNVANPVQIIASGGDICLFDGDAQLQVQRGIQKWRKPAE
jgi:hypothetical protein